MNVLDKENLQLIEKSHSFVIVNKPLPSKKKKIFRLNYLKSEKIVTVLSQLSQTYKNKPFISYSHDTNTIIVIATDQQIKDIDYIVSSLDIRKNQVFVEAKIIEMSEIKTKQVGIKYGLGSIVSNQTSLLSFSSSLNNGHTISMDSSLYNTTFPTASSVFALGATINVLKENMALDIISEPSILCLDNQTSSIYVGETRSVKTQSTTTNDGGLHNSYIRSDIGLKLNVLPQIYHNEVLLTITTSLEDIKEVQINQDNPITLKKEIKTTAIVKNGESIILGGLTKSKTDFISEEIPLLAQLPILGNLFKHNQRIEDKINLIIIITPYIIDKNNNLTSVMTELSHFKRLESLYTEQLKTLLDNNRPLK